MDEIMIKFLMFVPAMIMATVSYFSAVTAFRIVKFIFTGETE